jgi:hypothetical protein
MSPPRSCVLFLFRWCRFRNSAIVTALESAIPRYFTAKRNETSMKYLALIYVNEKEFGAQSYSDENIKSYMDFGQWLETAKKGQNLASEALQPISTATTVRVRDGKRTVTDGPFAETKEQLGGFYLLQAKNLDEAIEIASKIPDVRIGSIELRPVMEFSG